MNGHLHFGHAPFQYIVRLQKVRTLHITKLLFFREDIITKLNLEYTHFKISKFKVRIDHRNAIVVRLRFIFLTQKSESDQTLGLNLY